MKIKKDLSSYSIEELINLVRELIAENKHLRAENENLREEVARAKKSRPSLK